MKAIKNEKLKNRIRRHKRVRSRIHGTESTPRLAVFRSNKYIYVQLINDDKGVTIAQANDQAITKGTKKECAIEVGKKIAEEAKAKKVTNVVFDRGGFLYTGRIKALADAAREAGLEF